ncbi:hypothetical protein SAMN05661080_04230 [Modestobacter sp. DSM 44400]|uniref:DNRLRE domain-containing protein n=1 Tax=Modestobacter sp. DSM 44400 TaxID=1550230 RepID=UPI000895C8F5|nr:DNRLRE domain-containing protein [Modestobacter sp. DSM 44400]SDY66945.1 hypothetical protein SAMN05661080_04230 [Modestobacter sp. DSM 44400]
MADAQHLPHGRCGRGAATSTSTRPGTTSTGAPSSSYSISDDSRSATNDFDHDLYNGLIRAAAGAESQGIHAEATHASGWGMDAATRTGRFSLAAGSPGVDDGVPLPGFNDGWSGSAPDMGAEEAGAAPVTYGARAFGAVGTKAPATSTSTSKATTSPTTTTGATTTARPSATSSPTATTSPTATASSAASGAGSDRTITVTAEADAIVKEASPKSTFGAANPLLSDARDLPKKGSAVYSYLRFNVTGLAPGEKVTAASLSLRTVPHFGGTSNGPAIWRTADTSSAAAAESMTWRSGRPGRTGVAAVGNFGPARHDSQVTTAVSGVTGNGVVSLELAPEVTNGLIFLPREDAAAQNRPQLVLTVTSD